MSGGSYDYAYRRVQDMAQEVAHRHHDKPHVLAFAEHLALVATAMHAIEWADSADWSWDDQQVHRAIRAVISPAIEMSAAIQAAERAASTLRLAIDAALAEAEPEPVVRSLNSAQIMAMINKGEAHERQESEEFMRALRSSRESRDA